MEKTQVIIGRKIYTILTEFTSLDGDHLYVASVPSNIEGLYKHVILGIDNDGKWYQHI